MRNFEDSILSKLCLFDRREGNISNNKEEKEESIISFEWIYLAVWVGTSHRRMVTLHPFPIRCQNYQIFTCWTSWPRNQ